VTGYCGHGSECCSAIKGGDLFYQPFDRELLKKDCIFSVTYQVFFM
jgi:hypothetical protein